MINVLLELEGRKKGSKPGSRRQGREGKKERRMKGRNYNYLVTI